MRGMHRNKRESARAWGLIGLVALSLATLASAGSRADGGKLEGKGGEVPTPYADLNTKVELADGGDYLLIGRIVYPALEPFFHVDLAAHPWLENKRRASDPLYPLIEDGFDWKAYDGDWVTVSVRAEGRIVADKEGKPAFELYLRPLREPTAYQPDEDPAPVEPPVPPACEIPTQSGR